MNSETINAALSEIKYPGFSRDIVSFGLVQGVEYKDGKATIALNLTTSDPTVPTRLKNEVEQKVSSLEGVDEVTVSVIVQKPKTPPPSSNGPTGPDKQKLEKVKYIIAVASGKGGVGKSTFTVNLACALDKLLSDKGKAKSVGIMDCDIYGPSVPMMIGINQRPEVSGNNLVPIENFGIRVMSMGFLIDETTPVVWRGPMIMKTIQQFAANVEWGELEILVVDLPPGTGDAQLSLVQTLPLDGVVVVTTPQNIAMQVTRRGAMMFNKVNVPLLGVAENMSYLEMPNGEKEFVFGEGGGAQAAADLQTNFLGQVPLDTKVRQGADNGIPIVIGDADSPASEAFLKIAEQLLTKLN